MVDITTRYRCTANFYMDDGELGFAEGATYIFTATLGCEEVNAFMTAKSDRDLHWCQMANEIELITDCDEDCDEHFMSLLDLTICGFERVDGS